MTMNLIQQQTAAKDLPLQYLQQAVNGQNPNLTPWIATAELQRRTTMNQHMQKGQQGPMPTVKDQVEQKAGLMATDAARQVQNAQMQQAAMPPGPVPAGVPQPEAQPEQPVMAARGGLMNARTNLQFAKGGILGFDGEDESYVDPMTGVPLVNTSDRDNDITLREAITRGLGFKEEAAHQKANRKTNEATEARANAPAAPREVSVAARADDRAPRPSQQGQGIKAALPKALPAPQGRRAPAVTPTTTQPPTVNPMERAATDYINTPSKTPTAEDAIAEQSKYDRQYGLDKPVGAMQEKYLSEQDALQARRQKQAEDLAWSAYVQGTVGTPGSGALAYDTTKANALNQAGEFQAQRYKNLAELDTARRTANEKRATAAQGIGAADKLAAAAAIKDKASLAATMFNISSQAANAAAQNMTSLEVARIHAAAMNRPGETERLMATAIGLKATDPAKYATFMDTLNTIRGAGKPDQGAAIADKAYDNVVALMKSSVPLQMKYKDPAAFQAAVEAETARLRGNSNSGAASGASTRLKFDAQGNQIQ